MPFTKWTYGLNDVGQRLCHGMRFCNKTRTSATKRSGLQRNSLSLQGSVAKPLAVSQKPRAGASQRRQSLYGTVEDGAIRSRCRRLQLSPLRAWVHRAADAYVGGMRLCRGTERSAAKLSVVTGFRGRTLPSRRGPAHTSLRGSCLRPPSAVSGSQLRKSGPQCTYLQMEERTKTEMPVPSGEGPRNG
jgi:hypothetical protein